ncbi:beta strand repeat-containing protein [Cellvibrio polysaccharolyticus]|uniref:Bacterial repeat domain-containing protein n=1 Tax=Cellvibrio polysaccharolyticus TaxID=2082724 RepID=A0A928V629_9GAMM|nr:InlB B-repeat-containing protein [Cellvibrio polysaccharolyticus]MBE8718563.1 hypothetical protein [Cellvibrio polysaccharolyticus]
MKLPQFYGKSPYWLALMLGCFLALAGCKDDKKVDSGVKPPTEQPPVVQPPVEQPPTEQPPEQPVTVTLAGRVIGGNDAAGFTLSRIDGNGDAIATWTTDAAGYYQAEVDASDFYHLVATPIQPGIGSEGSVSVLRMSFFAEASAVSTADNSELEALCESSEARVTCNITPWTTLLLAVANSQNTTTEEIANQLQAMNYYHLQPDEDPFVLYREGALTDSDFDVAGVLALIEQTGGLSRWLSAMDNWLSAPNAAEAPVSVPRFTVSTQVSEGGSVSVSQQQVARSQQLSLVITPAPGYGIASVSGCNGSLNQTNYQTGAITADCLVSVNFARVQYTLDYRAGQGGSLQGATSQQVAYGQSGSEITAVPGSGYRFERWSDGRINNPRVDRDVTANLTLTAIFSASSYQINYTATGGGTILGTASQQINHGSNSTTVTAVPDAGFIFVKWSDGVTSNPRMDSNVTANMAVEAMFQIGQYNLIYTASAGGSLNGLTSQLITSGNDGSTVTATPNVGYVFVKWSDDVATSSRTDLNITANKLVEAIFELAQYSVVYTAGNGGTLGGNTSQNIAHGSNGAAVAAVPNVGYKFVKWSDELIANPRTDLNITANKSIAAIFELAEYSVIYSAGNGGTLSGNTSQNIAHGSNGAAVTAVPNAGYAFAKWSDGVTTNPRVDLDITAGKSIEAIFELVQYSVIYTAGNGGTLSGNTSQNISHGSNGAAVTAVPNAGYTFVRWSDDITTNPRIDLNIIANKTVEAIFEQTQYSVVYTAGNGGTLSGNASQNIAHGSDGAAVTAVPNPGYIFAKWSDDVAENPRVDLNITASKSVEAIFELAQYSVVYTAGNGGTLSGNTSQNIAHGSNGAAVTAVPNAGYTFAKWSDDVTTNPRTDLNITANKTVEAIFEPVQYSLTYTAAAGGTISGTTSQTVAHGNDGSIVTAVPDAGYLFVKWSDDVATSARTDLNVTANKSVEAIFELAQYSVVYTAGNGGTLSGSTSQNIAHGSNGAAVTAVPDAGYAFVKWSDDLTTNPRTDLNITADASIEAIFELKQYTVNYDVATGGSLSGQASQAINHGSDSTSVTVVADNGFVFNQWSDGSTDNPRVDVNVTSNISVVASFTRTAISLNIAEEHRDVINSSGAVQELNLLNSAGATAEYLLVPMNFTRDSNLQLTVDVSNNLLPNNGSAPSTGTALLQDSSLVNRKNHVAEYQLRRGTVGTGTPTSPISVIPAGVTPGVGDVWSLNSKLDSLCEVGTAANATIRYVGTNIIVVSDNDNPAGGFTSTQYETLGTTVDSFYSTITTTLGTPSDKDSNGKIVIFMTAGVNRLSPPASSVVNVAMYSPRDALTQNECPTSNLGEIIYVLAPDPTGAINSNVRTVSYVEGSAPAQIAHELAQLIIDSRRIAAGYDFGESWLNEALAAIAVEKVFFLRSTLNPLQNIVLSNLTTGANASVKVAAFNTYINSYFTNYRLWLQSPTRLGVLDSSGNELASRGLNWAFLRYVADRHANLSLAIEGAMYRNLVDSPYTGITNLENLINDDANTWLHDFLMSVYLDDYPGIGLSGSTGKYSATSWNYRSVYGGLGGFPLREMAIPAGGTTTAIPYAKDGGAGYIRIAVGAGETATIRLTPVAIPDQEASYTLIRLQ